MSVASGDIERAAAILSGAGYAVALTGAGLSVASGIPSFRGPGGLWTKYGPPANLSYGEFVRDPQGWWERRLNDEVTPGNPTYDLKAAVDRARPQCGASGAGRFGKGGASSSRLLRRMWTGCTGRRAVAACWRFTATATTCAASGAGWRRAREGYVISDLPPACGGVRRRH